MDYLTELNRLRVADGKVPLKHWAGTTDQLKKAILARAMSQAPQKTDQELIDEYLARGGDIKVCREHSAKGVRRQGGKRRRTAKRLGKGQGKKRLNGASNSMRTKAVKIPEDCFTLIEMAGTMDRAPAQVRQKARQTPAVEVYSVKELGRWVFRRSDWDTVRDILYPSR